LAEVRGQWERDLDFLRFARPESPAVKQLIGLRSRIDEHWHRLQEAIEPRLQSMPRQIVHGDVSPVNLVLGSDGQFSFIDWDCVHFGWRIYDALGDVLNRPPVERPDLNCFRQDHVAAYLAGYAPELDAPLSSAEEEMVPYFCLARQLEDLRQRVKTLCGLSERQDATYATLIARRVAMMDQIAKT
jgi:Ser/Thr protein kinase RdoA (MazF antagonist)